jgi:hypothetical protein
MDDDDDGGGRIGGGGGGGIELSSQLTTPTELKLYIEKQYNV